MSKKKNVVTIDVIDSIKESFSHIDSGLKTAAAIFIFFAPLIMMFTIIIKLIITILYHIKKSIYTITNDNNTISTSNYNDIELAELIVTNVKNGYNICKSNNDLKYDKYYNKIYTSITTCNSKMRKLKTEISNLSSIPNDDINAKCECRVRISDLLEYISYYQKKIHKSYVFLTDEQNEILDNFTLRMTTLNYGIFDNELDENTNFYDLDTHDTELINLFNDKIFVDNLRKCCIFKCAVSNMNE